MEAMSLAVLEMRKLSTLAVLRRLEERRRQDRRQTDGDIYHEQDRREVARRNAVDPQWTEAYYRVGKE